MTPHLHKKSPPRQEFLFLGDHPAIDFANTLAQESDGPRDFLTAWADVVDWLTQANLAGDARFHLPLSAQIKALVKVRALRRSWKAMLERLVAGSKVSDEFIAQLNQSLSADSFHDELERHGKSGFRLNRSASSLSGERLALAMIARQIAQFLAQENVGHIRRCANTESCVLYFYDTTKNHRRQWCSAATCGNRHKVAAFRQRQRVGKGRGQAGSPQGER